MNQNIIYYSLLCNNCKGIEQKSTSILIRDKSLINHSREELLSECDKILSQRRCSNCGAMGNYSICEIYCGAQPKQIHVQLTRSDGNIAVDIFDENSVHLNETLAACSSSDPLCQLVSRSLIKMKNYLPRIISYSQNRITNSIKNGIDGEIFYTIYEEGNATSLNEGNIVFIDNDFSYEKLTNALNWIEENYINALF